MKFVHILEICEGILNRNEADRGSKNAEKNSLLNKSGLEAMDL